MFNSRPPYNNRLFELEQELLKLRKSNEIKLVATQSDNHNKLKELINYSYHFYSRKVYNNSLIALEQEILEVRKRLQYTRNSQVFAVNSVEKITQISSLKDSPNGQLWELEKNLYNRKHCQPSQHQHQKSVSKEVISMAFDFDEPIELHYNGMTIPAKVSYKTTEEPYYKAFDKDFDGRVESFDVKNNDELVNESESFNKFNSNNTQTEYQTYNIEETVSANEDFAVNRSAIINEEIVNEKLEKQKDENQKQTIKQVIPQPITQKFSQIKSHSIFDQISENLAYANSFDLGTLTLEQRFDEFDRILDRQEQHSTAQTDNASNTTNNFYLNPFLGNGEL